MRILFIVILVVLFFSCSPPGIGPNPPGNPPPPTGDSTLLYKFIGYNSTHHPDTAITETYYYDINKRVSSIVGRQQFHNPPLGPSVQYDTLQFFYNGNDSLPQRIIHKIGQVTFPGPQYNQTNVHKIGYDGSGRIIFDTTFIGGQNPLEEYRRYIYMSSTSIRQYSKDGVGGNEVQSDYQLSYSGNNLFQQNTDGLLTYQLTFDNKVSPFSKVKGAHFFFPYIVPYSSNDLFIYRFSRNNITESRYYIYGPAPTTVIRSYSYTYRSDGFPLTMDRTGSNNVSKGVFIYY
jgi:hypothetical protein